MNIFKIKDLGSWLILLILGVLSIIGLFVLVYIPVRNIQLGKEFKEFGDTTFCRIIEATPYIKFEYYLNNQRYASGKVEVPFEGILEGECFQLLYSNNDHETCEILYHRPYLCDKASFDSTTSVDCEEKTRFLSPRNIMFSYKIGDRLYKRWQRLGEDAEIEKRPYKVMYKKSNPQIAYIYIE